MPNLLLFGGVGAPVPGPGVPDLQVLLGRPTGWTLGIVGRSELGVTTNLGPNYAYTNIISKVRHTEWRRGRSHELDRVEALRGSILVLNQDGNFNTTNTAGAYWPDLIPMAPFIIRAVWDGDTYDLLHGFAEAYPATWSGAQIGGDDNVIIDLVDGFKVLNLSTVTLDRPAEATGARITAVLDAVGWDASLRAIDDGEFDVQAVSGTINALAHIQETALSEGGIFFIDRNGKATFYDRFHATILDETNNTWGDGTGEKHYASITTSNDDSNLWNKVTVSANGLTDQTVEDTTSQQKFGGPALAAKRTLPVSTNLATEADMLEQATFLLGKYSEPHLRVTSMSVENASLDNSQWRWLLSNELHDRILVRKRPGAGDMIEQPSFIEGVSFDISSRRWLITWNLSAASITQGQWTLGVVGKSELGVTTTLVTV